MFAALVVKERPKNCLKRFTTRFFSPAPAIARCPVPGSPPFFTVTVSGWPRINWEQTADAAGRFARRMLLPTGIFPPEGGLACALEPSSLPSRRLIATVCAILDEDKALSRAVTLTMVDLPGKLLCEVEQLVRRVSVLRIVSAHPEVYESAADYVMERYGATLPILEPVAGDCLSGTVLAPFGFPEELYAAPGTRLLTTAPSHCDKGITLTPGDTQLPEPYSELLPPGIEPDAFAGALYDCCGVKSLAAVPFLSMREQERVLSLRETANLIFVKEGLDLLPKM